MWVDAVLCAGANAGFPTGYDSKGYRLMRLAGHAVRHWPVSSRPCGFGTSQPLSTASLGRLAFSRATLAHATLAHTTLLHRTFVRTNTHTQLFHIRLCHTPSFNHTHNLVTQTFHTEPTTLSRTSFTQNFITHTQLLTYNFLTDRSSTTSSVFPSFLGPLHFLFLLIGRTCLVGLSGP